MTDRELLRQALDALISVWNMDKTTKQVETIQAIKARLAQPEKEWVGLTNGERLSLWSDIECDLECLKPAQYARTIEAKLKEKNT